MEERRTKASGLSWARRMGFLVLHIVLMGAQQSEANRVCGQPQLNLNRLVKGQDTVPGEFPWQASIQWKGVHMCGGSLINDQWVTLQKLQVPIIDSKTCRNLYLTNVQNRPPHRNIQDDMICAGYAEGMRDACNGDSGGPMACIVGDVWVLAGIVSWGEGCAIKNRPGVYSRLTSYQSWIREYIPNLEFVKEPKGRESRAVADIKGQKHPGAGWPSQAASVVASTLLLLACLLYLI
ncbi:Serine protease 27 [Platysternon megacephalum]|uniref:Serine protease 27 n=1 Tax=Platysternon megacephalum TaxID=55544 RepID=A0A4D9DKP1_9SAUR|nr:Serine protease 27 [Platysternon megacephalum]